MIIRRYCIKLLLDIRLQNIELINYLIVNYLTNYKHYRIDFKIICNKIYHKYNIN